MSYKKRDKGNWNQGKRYKGSRKAKEKNYAKRDIQQQIDSQDEDYRVKHYSRTPNKKAQLKYRVNWYETMIKFYRDNNITSTCVSWFRSSLQKAKNKLKELNENNDN